MESSRPPYLKHIYVCLNQRQPGEVCCGEGNGEAIKEILKAFVKANGLQGKVRVSGSGCFDLCAQGPNVMVYPDYRWYKHVGPADVERIIAEELAPLVHKPGPEAPARGLIRAFFFDMGNVLIHFDHMRVIGELAARSRLSKEELLRFFMEEPVASAHELGRVSAEHLHDALMEKAGLQIPYDNFLEIWNSSFTEMRETVAILRKLVDRYPCVLVSNTNRTHFDYCRVNFPILEEMRGWVLSYEVGAVKPNPAIYARALEMVRVPPEAVFYTDDRADLIEAARRMGFRSHQFQSAALLAEELRTLSVAL